MTKFGQYQVVDVVSLTATGAVSTVRLPRRSGVLFALKQIKSTQTDPDEPQWDSQLFLDRVRVQKSVVAAGGKYWLPVRDMGATAQGAWVVTDYYPLSAQKLIEARSQPGTAELHHLVECVVKGLVELQQARGRAHGNLKPSNVIIEPGDLSQSSVYLTDPAHGTVHNEADDLYALGELIYQLVARQPFLGGESWPVEDSTQWQKLGKSADKWRELCSDLLSPDPGSRPKLADVSWIVRELAPRKPRIRLPRRLWLAPVAAGCVAIVALAVVGAMTLSARHEIARANATWADEFAAALANPQRRARFQSDPSVKLAVVQLDAAREAEGGLDLGGLSAVNPMEMLKTRKTAAQLTAARLAFSPDRWPRMTVLGALRQQALKRGWNQPAAYLGNLAATMAAPGHGLANSIDQVLTVETRVERDERKIDPVWRQLDDNSTRLEKTGDPTLGAFGRGLRRSVARQVTLSDAGFQGLDALATYTELSDRLVKAVPGDWPANVDSKRLAIDVGSTANLSRPAAPDMELWLKNLPLYTIRKAETSVAASSLQKRLKEIDDIVSKSSPPAEDRAAFDRARKQVAGRIDGFAATAFIEKEFEDGLVTSRQSAIEAELQSLRRFAKPETATDLGNNLGALTTHSKRINDYWEHWKSTELKDHGQGAQRRTNLLVLKSRSEDLRSLLTTIDQELPATPANLPRAIAEIGERHRDEVIGTLLDTVDPKEPRLDSLKFATAAGSVAEWGRLLPKFAGDFPLKQSFIGPDLKLDEKWAGHESFFQDPLIQQFVKPDMQRVAALRQLSGDTREQLVDAARSSDRAEVAFEAWRLLDAASMQPPWPSGPREIVTERDLRHRLENLLASVKDADRQRPLEIFRAQGPARWRAGVERARDEQTLTAAWQARDAYGVDSSQIAAMSASARFNLWLWRTRSDLAGGDEVALRQSSDQLEKAAGELKEPAAMSVTVSLSQPVEKKIFGKEPPGDRVLVALAGVQPPVEFRRVEIPDGKPFYLATTEISVGQFIAVVDASRAWSQCRQLPWSNKPGQPDARRGPRVWEWSEGGGMTTPRLWMARDEDNDFAPGLRAERFNRMTLRPEAGGMPSASHPMQQVSAETALWFAALCGCRLPTAQEWQAAYNRFEKNVSSDQLNLRDQTWETQRQYYLAAKPSSVGTSWLFDDVFRAGIAEHESASNLRTRVIVDGTLFFKPVDESGGSVFHHLVGNVAEYLCEDWERFENLADGRSPRVISSFAAQSAGSFSVIGGSALSAPDGPVEKPVPLAHADRGYADVGFRLAISAPPRSLAEKVKWALRGQTYLWPNQYGQAKGHGAEVGFGH